MLTAIACLALTQALALVAILIIARAQHRTRMEIARRDMLGIAGDVPHIGGRQ